MTDAAAMLDAIIGGPPEDLVEDLALLAYDGEEVAARLESFWFDDERLPTTEEVAAVMAEADKRLADDPGPY